MISVSDTQTQASAVAFESVCGMDASLGLRDTSSVQSDRRFPIAGWILPAMQLSDTSSTSSIVKSNKNVGKHLIRLSLM